MKCKKRWCKEFVGHRSKAGLCYKHRGFPPTINFNIYDNCNCGNYKIKKYPRCNVCKKKDLSISRKVSP